jgi:hypothetical protein
VVHGSNGQPAAILALSKIQQWDDRRALVALKINRAWFLKVCLHEQ